jgi:hypothetical protein
LTDVERRRRHDPAAPLVRWRAVVLALILGALFWLVVGLVVAGSLAVGEALFE